MAVMALMAVVSGLCKPLPDSCCLLHVSVLGNQTYFSWTWFLHVRVTGLCAVSLPDLVRFCPQVNALYAAHEEYLSERSYFDNSIDSIQANMHWLQLNAERVCTWLQSV